MHRLLQRQLKSATSEDGALDLERLVHLVSQAYEETDLDQKRTDRSITLMIQELDQANAEIRESQTRRFEAAVANMPHGLVMFDKENRLVICNEPYAGLYELPEQLTQPGTTYWDIFDYRETIGATEARPPDELRKMVRDSFKDRIAFTKSITLRNGRVVRMHQQPMEDGGWVSTHEDITERHRSQETIRMLAQHDSLTGLANRVTFREEMTRAERLIAGGNTMAVFYLDLDKFKPINDLRGHLAGDAVLKAVGERIRDSIGERGLVARLGGDEFAALVGPVEDEASLAALAEGILEAVATPISVDGLEIRIDASVGIAVAPRDGVVTDSLMRSGDEALYEAKTGKLGYCFFDRNMDERRRRRLSIETDLRQAIDNKGLVLHYQPMLTTDDLGIVCCEALLRWNRPGEGLVSPADFIPVAEETGQIREIGGWVLMEACRTAVWWPGNTRVAVNVSPIQFGDDTLVKQVSQALHTSGLSAERLELEITESLFLADDAHNLSVLHRLHDLGVRIVLDDFGTGYSSLSYLRTFPFDAIKIDRSFIMSATERPDTAAITNTIVQLGAALGMDTTAEGIETEEQLALVRQQGCTAVQGFLFSPPLTERAMLTMLQHTRGGEALRLAV